MRRYSRKAINPKSIIREFTTVHSQLQAALRRLDKMDEIDPSEIRPLFNIYKRIGQLQSPLQNVEFNSRDRRNVIFAGKKTRYALRGAMAAIKKGYNVKITKMALRQAEVFLGNIVILLENVIRKANRGR